MNPHSHSRSRSALPARERVAAIARLRREVARVVDRDGVIEPGEKVVVGVSGGADSTALLDVLARLAPPRGWRLHCVHIDHGLRIDSGGEADAVAALAAARDVTFESIRATLPVSGSPQERARRGRYAALAAAADRAGASAIAVGHTADDQAETVLMRVLHGAPPPALAAMRARTGRLARPLLGAWRTDTAAYCAALGLTPLDDPSNGDPRFLRTRIRNEVLPAIEAVLPAARRRLVELAASHQAVWPGPPISSDRNTG